jgi:hypothetical protein
MKTYDRTWHIQFTCTSQVARLLAIALKAEKLGTLDLSHYIKLGFVAPLNPGVSVDNRIITIAYGNNTILTWRLEDGWAVGVTEIPVNWSSDYTTWAGGDRTKTTYTNRSGTIYIPETLSGEITYVDGAVGDSYSKTHGKKTFMGGWVE